MRSGQRGHTSFLEHFEHIVQATACYAERPLYVPRVQGRDERKEIGPNSFAGQLKRQNLCIMKTL